MRRLKIVFHVEDLGKPKGERIIIGPMQIAVEVDENNLTRPSQASESLDAAGTVIGRYVLLALAGKTSGVESWVRLDADTPSEKGTSDGRDRGV